MSILLILKNYPYLVYLLMISEGLMAGSFLTVLIVRYPIMLGLQYPSGLPYKAKTFNLALPSSHCPQCRKTLRFWHNIPLLSYLWLRGQCAYCHRPISFYYPLVEICTATLTIAVEIKFGLTSQTLAGWIFTWALIGLSFIDIREKILPDTLTLSFLWLGLCMNAFHLFTSSQHAILGALLGYLSFWLTAYLFQRWQKKEGLGHGDFKMLAMIGAWLGYEALPNVIIIASGLGATAGILLLLTRQVPRHYPLPFGPFLAIGGWLTFILN